MVDVLAASRRSAFRLGKVIVPDEQRRRPPRCAPFVPGPAQDARRTERADWHRQESRPFSFVEAQMQAYRSGRVTGKMPQDLSIFHSPTTCFGGQVSVCPICLATSGSPTVHVKATKRPRTRDEPLPQGRFGAATETMGVPSWLRARSHGCEHAHTAAAVRAPAHSASADRSHEAAAGVLDIVRAAPGACVSADALTRALYRACPCARPVVVNEYSGLRNFLSSPLLAGSVDFVPDQVRENVELCDCHRCYQWIVPSLCGLWCLVTRACAGQGCGTVRLKAAISSPPEA